MDKSFKWIVLSEKKGAVQLVSKSKLESPGLLPTGSFLTIEDKDCKFIVRVVDSNQIETYSPSPMVADMNLGEFALDQKCQNIINAVRVKNISTRTDGLIDFVKPQLKARKSTKDEVHLALGVNDGDNGVPLFLTSVQYTENKILTDKDNNFLSTIIKDDMFYHQIMISGKTGSGKTVAAKYLCQHFIESVRWKDRDGNQQTGGAVIAINVKDTDLLHMEKKTDLFNEDIENEWKSIARTPKGIENTRIYYPANNDIRATKGIDYSICEPITLDVNDIEPESLTGVLQGITDKGALSLIPIFRFWKEDIKGESFGEFIRYFDSKKNEGRLFDTKNARGDNGEVTLHPSTFDSISRSLDNCSDFFDNKEANVLSVENVIGKSFLSVINVAGEKGIEFGSLVLRHLLKKIVEYKNQEQSDIPILIIIDEVHLFYGNNASRETLATLDTICRIGRSKKIGVVFASQNPKDLPKGIESVVNTKMYFRGDDVDGLVKNYNISKEDAMNLKPGYGYGTIYGLPGVKTFKMPMSLSGVRRD